MLLDLLNINFAVYVLCDLILFQSLLLKVDDYLLESLVLSLSDIKLVFDILSSLVVPVGNL